MAKAGGTVVLRGRFKPGAKVSLVQVAHEGVLRAEGGRTVARKRVGEDRCVRFDEGVEVGGRYFIVGQIDGEPVEVRATGKAADEAEDLLLAPGVVPERQKLADGSWQDEIVPLGAPRQAPEHPIEEAPAAPKRKPAAKRPAAKKTSTSRSRASQTTKAKPGQAPARKEK